MVQNVIFLGELLRRGVIYTVVVVVPDLYVVLITRLCWTVVGSCVVFLSRGPNHQKIWSGLDRVLIVENFESGKSDHFSFVIIIIDSQFDCDFCVKVDVL